VTAPFSDGVVFFGATFFIRSRSNPTSSHLSMSFDLTASTDDDPTPPRLSTISNLTTPTDEFQPHRMYR